MVSSPCKTCSLKKQPKDQCLKDCKKIEALQDILSSVDKSIEEYGTSTAIDYADVDRFVVNHEDFDYWS